MYVAFRLRHTGAMTDLRPIEVRFTDADLALLAEMERQTSFSKSKLVRLTIAMEYGNAKANARARAELARAVLPPREN